MLTEAELALVERAGRTYRDLMKVGCTGCGYCLPCPAGVAIPGCFDQYNRMHMFGNEETEKFVYAFRMSGELANEPPGFASQCVRCGACLAKCPQQLPIPDFLAQVAAEMEGPALTDRLTMARHIFKIEAK
jgi:uncharacterized protein